MNYPLITAESRFDYIILADGDFPSHQIPLGILGNAKSVICCDGAGAQFMERLKRLPAAIVGDGDSLSEDFKKQYPQLFHHIKEQEDNDLTKATKYALSLERNTQDKNPDKASNGIRQHSSEKPTLFAYLGATGKREDHTFSNIGLMIHYLEHLNIHPVMVTDYGWFVPAQGDCTFGTMPRQQVSIFNFSCKRLDSKGLVWSAYPYKELWQGSLNEAIGKQIELNGDGYYLVYRTFEIKKNRP
ncbi:thiamine diphosphokinase [Prevotella cerevisiae]|uniref:Thiamine diphosphokinase n=1 Tax=Segatella cerevisiae TaxID=2053716 RepID=A0ABT1BYC0_9BACT|nr:thiamine diphosphokinase [Segatella cerevisiae]MCO6025685.1 thiamine diphosphokinase [Segatella cerevisiae]